MDNQRINILNKLKEGWNKHQLGQIRKKGVWQLKRKIEKKDGKTKGGTSPLVITNLSNTITQDSRQEQRRDSQGEVLDILNMIRQDIRNSEERINNRLTRLEESLGNLQEQVNKNKREIKEIKKDRKKLEQRRQEIQKDITEKNQCLGM